MNTKIKSMKRSRERMTKLIRNTMDAAAHVMNSMDRDEGPAGYTALTHYIIRLDKDLSQLPRNYNLIDGRLIAVTPNIEIDNVKIGNSAEDAAWNALHTMWVELDRMAVTGNYSRDIIVFYFDNVLQAIKKC